MLITSLELRNVKSYGERGIRIPFQSGVNLICGQNGSGKSTILESIGYALFDALDYKHAQFCREGEKSGQIVLTFLSGLDERQYQVIRGVGRSKFEIYDLATKSYLTRSRGNSQDWLMEHLGVEMDYASVLFSNAVGVSHGRMIGSFLESKRGRESHFNSMLRVDEYEKAWEKLRETKRYLNEQLTEADKVVAYLTGQLTRLPWVCEQEKRLAAQIQADRDALSETGARLRTLEHELSAWDAAFATVERLIQQLNEANQALASLDRERQGALKALQAAEKAAAIVAESAAGYTAYEEALRQRDELEARRKVRDRQEAALRATERDLTEITTTLAHLNRELEAVAKAEARLAALVPLVERQMALEKEASELEKSVAEHKRATQRALEADQRIANLTNTLANIQTQLKERRDIEERLSALAKERSDLTKQLDAFPAQLTPLREQRTLLEADVRRATEEKQDYQNAKERLSDEQATLARLQAELTQIEAQLAQRTALLERLDTIEQTMSLDLERKQAAQHAAEMAQQRIDF
jgi:exonuclease SbcC